MQDTYKDHIEQNKQYYFFHVVAFFCRFVPQIRMRQKMRE